MKQRRFNMDALAALGKRWFAKPPSGYSTPSESAISDFSIYANQFYETEIGGIIESSIAALDNNSQITRITYAQHAQRWLRENGPTFFVGEELLDMFENTDVLSCIEGNDIKTVYPTGYICLPQGRGIKSPFTGDRLHHIWFQIFEAGDYDVFINGRKHSLTIEERKCFIVAYWDKIGDCSSFLFPLGRKDITILDLIQDGSDRLLMGQVNRGKTQTSTGMDESELRSESKEVSMWMAPLVVNILLLMQSYPQYFQKLSQEDSQRQSFKDRPAPSSMILHRSSSRDIQQKVKERSKTDGEPTGITLCRHWRRGHWRKQIHGDRWELENPEVKVIELKDLRRAHMNWLMPIFVNAEMEQDPQLVRQVLNAGKP